MATISETLTPNYSHPNLRQFDARRDLGPVADLIELCFVDTLDPDGRRYLERMRSMAARPRMLQWANSTPDWTGSPFFGYVWQEGERIVGNVSLIPYPQMGKRLFLIANVAVHPDYRRRGIARQLTLQAVAHARQRQAPAVWLQVREENSSAQALYSQLGFVEKARRTTWIGSSEPDIKPFVPGVKFSSAQARHWTAQRPALLRSYPPELSWHMSFDINIINPGLWGAVWRMIKQTYTRQWSALAGREWLGSLTWQLSPSYANMLWLALPEKADEQVVRGLLLYARQKVASIRPLALDYPAGFYSSSIQSAGFSSHQTLIWMELALL